AHLIVNTGVHYVALMPAIHHTEAKLVKNFIKQGLQPNLVASTMVGQNYINQSQECGVKTIILFNAVSDRNFRKRSTNNKTPLAVHFHNDRGLALENTIQAVLAGATGISGTFGGIGERAGNVAIEQVFNGLKLRYGWQVKGIKYDALTQVTNYLNSQGFQANNPYSAETLRCETGIHIDSLLRDRNSYYLFPHGVPDIWFGKFSGASNFQYLFEKQLEQPLSTEDYQKLREKIKNISIQQKRSFSAEEVLGILRG
ncbi:MAG: 2-isopropylmalate synthase, partial [Waterburya sp.]